MCVVGGTSLGQFTLSCLGIFLMTPVDFFVVSSWGGAGTRKGYRKQLCSPSPSPLQKKKIIEESKLYIPVSSCQGCSSLQGTAFEHCSALSHAEPAQRKLFPQIQLELRLPAQHSQHCSLFSGTLPLTAEAASKSQGRKIFNGRVP